jgi:hypothetical protein
MLAKRTVAISTTTTNQLNYDNQEFNDLFGSRTVQRRSHKRVIQKGYLLLAIHLSVQAT